MVPKPNTNPDHPEDMPVWTDTQDAPWPPQEDQPKQPESGQEGQS